jgi:hypothetical protein
VQWGDSTGHTESSLYDGKKYTKINVPGAANTYAQGIDTAGDIAYWWQDSSYLSRGALQTGGKFYKFNDPHGAQETFANGINDYRLIVGVYVGSSGVAYGFKATY